MNRIRTGAASLNQTPLDWIGNRRRILEAIELARKEDVTLLCLPELCITGYGCEDAFLSLAVAERAWQELEGIAPETKGTVVGLGLPVFLRGAMFNAAALLVDGEIAGLVAKQNLAGDGLHYEPRWFKPWPAGQQSTIGPNQVPIGDVLFEVGGVRIGFEICEDAWIADPPGIRLAQHGMDLLLNPSASHFSFGKQNVRKGFVLDNSRALACSYVYANLVGNEAGRAIYDGGSMIAQAGKLLVESHRLHFQEVSLVTAVIDVALTRYHQARIVSRDICPEFEGLKQQSFDWPTVEPQPPTPAVTQELSKEEEFTRAISLGLFDYVRKSRSRGFVVSLSGGADSAACACLVYLMLQLAEKELGKKAVQSRLGTWLGDSAGRMERLLACVYQGTRNSSKTTRNAAKAVADAIGASFHEWDIDGLVERYGELCESAAGRDLTWEQDDLALQNIQARVRAPGIWMLTNVRGALLISTSNRSEAAVGYATMDGDTCGGISPIAGIDKAFLRQWLRWLEKDGAPAIGVDPIPALSAVNEQQPTAELRPQSSKQTDEDDLMPYPVLDAIERCAIRDKRMPKDVLEHMRVQFPKHDEEKLREWVKRFFMLWSRNQWKRERYAPSFHVDDENLDPKTWCRFPILSGGFADELSEL